MAETIRASVGWKKEHYTKNKNDDVRMVQRLLAVAATNALWLGTLPPGAISNFSAELIRRPSSRV